jgi:hypothetical protein
MKRNVLTLAAAAVLAFAGNVVAAEVTERIQGGALAFSGGQTYTNAVLLITGPNGFEMEKTATRGLPTFRIQGGERIVDGFYQYSLQAATDEKVPAETKFDNGRGANAQQTALKPFSMYGTFQVSRGLIVPVETADGGPDVDPAE